MLLVAASRNRVSQRAVEGFFVFGVEGGIDPRRHASQNTDQQIFMRDLVEYFSFSLPGTYGGHRVFLSSSPHYQAQQRWVVIFQRKEYGVVFARNAYMAKQSWCMEKCATGLICRSFVALKRIFLLLQRLLQFAILKIYLFHLLPIRFTDPGMELTPVDENTVFVRWWSGHRWLLSLWIYRGSTLDRAKLFLWDHAMLLTCILPKWGLMVSQLYPWPHNGVCRFLPIITQRKWFRQCVKLQKPCIPSFRVK